MSQFDLSVIIVNFNSGHLLRQNIESLIRFIRDPFEVIVVDNQSTDDSLEQLPIQNSLTVIRNDHNLGFPKACNIGYRAAHGRILHFLNPDAQVTENINFVYEAARERIGSIHVTRIMDTRRNTERSMYSLPTLANMYRMLFRPSQVQHWYLGASVVLDHRLFERLGGWREDYFL